METNAICQSLPRHLTTTLLRPLRDEDVGLVGHVLQHVEAPVDTQDFLRSSFDDVDVPFVLHVLRGELDVDIGDAQTSPAQPSLSSNSQGHVALDGLIAQPTIFALPDEADELLTICSRQAAKTVLDVDDVEGEGCCHLWDVAGLCHHLVHEDRDPRIRSVLLGGASSHVDEDHSKSRLACDVAVVVGLGGQYRMLLSGLGVDAELLVVERNLLVVLGVGLVQDHGLGTIGEYPQYLLAELVPVPCCALEMFSRIIQ